MSGFFITFEGIEGCGKTTQILLLRDFLRTRNYDAVLTREPGGTSIGDQIRKVLLLSENKSMRPITELLLYAAARNQHVEEIIMPSLEVGKVVLCDRYADATTAYQGAARKIKNEFLTELHDIATGGLQPNLTILFDCPANLGLERAKVRNEEEKKTGVEDRFEEELLDFHERVRAGYLNIAKKEPNRVKVIDATLPPKAVHQRVIIEVMKLLQ